MRPRGLGSGSLYPSSMVYRRARWISNWLAQGDYACGNDLDLWLRYDAVLNLEAEDPHGHVLPAPPGKDYLHMPFEDGDADAFETVLPGLLAFIKAERDRNRSVLVHCMAGVSRSVATCLAYALKYGVPGSAVLEVMEERIPRIETESDFAAWFSAICDLTGTRPEQVMLPLQRYLFQWAKTLKN